MKPSIAVIHPYWDFWEPSVAGDLRASRQQLLARATELLSVTHQILVSTLVSSSTEASGVIKACEGADAIVVLSSMAVPPATGMSLLEALPEVPVVIWAVAETESLPLDFSHSDITTCGATVGAPMLGSALARLGRPFDLVVSTLEAPGSIRSAVRRASAAGRVRSARILRIGDAIPGYTSVNAPAGGLAALGPRLVDIAPEELIDRSHAIGLDRIDEIRAEIEAQFDGLAQVEGEALTRVIRTEVALREIAKEVDASAGSLNCHVASLRPSSRFGIAPCLALGRLTTDGIPWTCTGDVLTAIAMLVVQSLGHPTLYHEIEALDHTRDEAILANTGEHDLRLCGDRRPDLADNVWYQNDPLSAPCTRFSIPPGPASLVGFVFAPEPRFVVAEGTFTGRECPSTGTPNAGFRFASGPVGEAWARWGRAGVLHHSAATNALLASDLAVVAHHLGAAIHVV